MIPTPPIRRLLLSAAILLAVAAGPAAAEPFEAGPVWTGNIVRDGGGRLESCAVLREFDDDSVLSFALTRDGDFFLVVGNPRFRLPEGQTRTVRYRVDKSLTYEAPADLLRGSAIIDLPDADGTQDLLRHGQWLYLDGLGEEAGYSLDGVRQGLRAMADCVRKELPAQAPPGGAFADLGVYDTEARARQDWPHMKKTAGGLLDGREPQFLSRTRSTDRRTVVTLRLPGFTDRAEAERLCTALRAKRIECTVR